MKKNYYTITERGKIEFCGLYSCLMEAYEANGGYNVLVISEAMLKKLLKQVSLYLFT